MGLTSQTTAPSGEVETQVVECHPTPKSPLIRNVWALLLVHRIEPSGEPDPVSPSSEVVIPRCLRCLQRPPSPPSLSGLVMVQVNRHILAGL